jgi:hypothetical protein
MANMGIWATGRIFSKGLIASNLQQLVHPSSTEPWKNLSHLGLLAGWYPYLWLDPKYTKSTVDMLVKPRIKYHPSIQSTGVPSGYLT